MTGPELSNRTPFTLPGRRLFRPPDLRGLVTPRLSAAPLSDEIDYDDLVVHRSWRSFDMDTGTVRYFMYELSQKDPSEEGYRHFYKAVRFLRVTRVPRYLRNLGNDGPSMVFEHQRDLLAAMRDQGVLFLNLVAKSPDLPLVFAWGVQAVGATEAEAVEACDESYAVLEGQVDGTYQQLRYKPLTIAEGESLARYQREWNHIATGRGRPSVNGMGSGISSMLDGNRTDVESTHSALDSIIRGMADRSFMLTLVTVPVSPSEMAVAWRNVTEELSATRSEQQGSRGVSAGVALPLGFGSADGHSHGTSHSAGESIGQGASEGLSHTDTTGFSESVGHTDSVTHSQSHTDGTTVGRTVGESHSVADSVTQSTTLTESTSASESSGASFGEGFTLGHSQGQSLSHSASDSISASQGTTDSVGISQSHSTGISESASQSHQVGVSQSQSIANTDTVGANWSSSVNQGLNSSLTNTTNLSETLSRAISQNFGLTGTWTDSYSENASRVDSESLNSSIGLFGAGIGDSASRGHNMGLSSAWAQNLGLTAQDSQGLTLGHSQGSSVGQSTSVGETAGGSRTIGSTATHGVGSSESLGTTRSVGQSIGMSEAASRSASLSQSMSQGHTQSVGVGQNVGATAAQSQQAGVSQSASLGQSAGISESYGVGRTVGSATSVADSVARSSSDTVGQSVSSADSQTATASVSAAAGSTASVSQQQAATAAYLNAMSRTAQQSSSIGAVPNLAYNISKSTFDEGKRAVGDLLEAQMHRYLEGVNTGGFLYQMFLVCPDRATLARGAGLLKSAFWGPGKSSTHQPQPFHVVDNFKPDEAERLLLHASAFTSYRKRETKVELIEPWVFSTYLTAGEGAAFTTPPLAEASGLLATFDSMPVFAMPRYETPKDLHLGRLIYGERAEVTDEPFGLDLDELHHLLLAGATGMGKSTTLMRLIAEAARVERTVVETDPDTGVVTEKKVYAGALVLDWKDEMRNLASVVPNPHERFRFWSLSDRTLGGFRFNLLALPDETMSPVEWANSVADLFMVSYGLGEFARSIIWECVNELYSANRLTPYVLRPEVRDDEDTLLRPGITLPAVDVDTLPDDGIGNSPDGSQIANVYTCPALSRLVSLPHLAVLVATRIEAMLSTDAAKLQGSNMRDRLQTVWRRVMYMAPGGPYAELLGGDERLDERRALSVKDLVDPDRGLICVIEADGIDISNRRLVLGGIINAVWRYGSHHRRGVFNHDGKGPGTLLVLEEAHEILGEQGDDESSETGAKRTSLYQTMFRMARSLGLKIVACVQNPGQIPSAITSNTTTVICHRVTDERDRKVVGNLFNWIMGVGQHFREYRYLGEMPVGYAIARLNAVDDYLESAPIHFKTDPLELPAITDAQIRRFWDIQRSRGR